MAENHLTLLERLVAPEWSHGPGDSPPTLDIESTVADMKEAAVEIVRLRSSHKKLVAALQEIYAEGGQCICRGIASEALLAIGEKLKASES